MNEPVKIPREQTHPLRGARLILAPLRGVTLAPFRTLLGTHFGGVTEAVAPFIALGTPGKVNRKIFADVLPEENRVLPTIPQVIGKSPEALRDTALALRELGYTKLNLNCGCPWKFVAKKGRGSGLMETRDNLERMLESGCTAMPGGFSVKIRLGYRSETTLLSLVDVLNRYPITELTIHPRTGEQMYGGTVHLNRFAEVLPLLTMPVVYNGDLFTAEDVKRVWETFPTVSALMIGRGLCANPLLAEEVRGISAPATSPLPAAPARERIAAFARELEAHYEKILFGPAPLMGRLKELWSYLHRSFETGEDGLCAIQRSASLEQLRAAIRALVEKGKENGN